VLIPGVVSHCVALVEHPESSDLMYDRSMVLEKLDRIADAEAMLRKLVEMKPEDPQALNALGYTLVDRTSRVQEGFELIEKAHKLAPKPVAPMQEAAR